MVNVVNCMLYEYSYIFGRDALQMLFNVLEKLNTNLDFFLGSDDVELPVEKSEDVEAIELPLDKISIGAEFCTDMRQLSTLARLFKTTTDNLAANCNGILGVKSSIALNQNGNPVFLTINDKEFEIARYSPTWSGLYQRVQNQEGRAQELIAVSYDRNTFLFRVDISYMMAYKPAYVYDTGKTSVTRIAKPTPKLPYLEPNVFIYVNYEA